MDRPSKSSAAAAAASLSDLPDEAHLEILSRLPLKPLRRAKCVAKAWRDLIDDPLHRNKLPQTLEGFFDCVGSYLGFISVVERRLPLDIDPRFSFLTELPGIEKLCLKDSSNGLILFEHVRKSQTSDVLGYIVCNPATKRWAMVPLCGCQPHADSYTYLFFDPAASAHFHVLMFCSDCVTENVELVEEEEEELEDEEEITVVPLVHAYSSETGRWSHSKRDWSEEEQGQLQGWCQDGQEPFSMGSSAFLNGMLHLLLIDGDQIVSVDLQGKTQRVIQLPIAEKDQMVSFGYYIATSQGRLHFIHEKYVGYDAEQSHQLFVWVLNDYDTQEWILKGTVNLSELFGEKSSTDGKTITNLHVVSMHPDRNVVFFVQTLNKTLISYHLDHKEVSVIATFKYSYHTNILPYVPYFSESPALTDMH